jgi:ribokinase
LENRHETVFHGIRKCHEWGIPVLLDPAPAAPLPADLYPCIDIIKPNETEATILTGIEVKNLDSAIPAGRWLIDKGVRHALVTLGAMGSVLVEKGKASHIPAPKVNAIDTTGAGDIFAGAFLASLYKGSNIDDAIRFGSHAAAMATTKIGVVNAIPTLAEVEKFMAEAGSR